jgi:hypothetical protein
MALATRPRDVRNVARDDERVARLREIRERLDVLLRDAQVRRVHPALGLHRRRDDANGVRVRVRDELDRARLARGLVDLRLLLALGFEDRRLALAVGDVDLLLALALGSRDHRALLALGGDLRLHRAQDRLGRREALDLVAQHLDTPGAAGFVEHLDDVMVDLVAALEGAVELHLADHERSAVCASCVIAWM